MDLLSCTFFIFSVAEKRIVYGVTSTFSVDMLVGNFGEPAYQAMMKMNYSADFKVDSVTVDGVSVTTYI